MTASVTYGCSRTSRRHRIRIHTLLTVGHVGTADILPRVAENSLHARVVALLRDAPGAPLLVNNDGARRTATAVIERHRYYVGSNPK